MAHGPAFSYHAMLPCFRGDSSTSNPMAVGTVAICKSRELCLVAFDKDLCWDLRGVAGGDVN